MTVNITIANDSIQENTEGFTVLIERIGGVTSAEVTIGTPNPTMVDIADNNG